MLKKEKKITTNDLIKANIKLKELDQAKSDFVSIASHQLRTPLTIIKGYVSMLLEGNFGNLNKKEREAMKKVFESNERLIRIVENLLNVSRIESGKMLFNFQKKYIQDIITSVINEFSNILIEKNIKLICEKPIKPLPKIAMDVEKIRQVILNLVDNAIKYSNNGKIVINLKIKNKKIIFCIKDHGIGIKKEDMPNLFTKLRRGTGAALICTEGTGLGLYVSKQIILGHKGKIWAESIGEGKGSKFLFELPINRLSHK
jgi:signal transduction histidine kinase